MENLSYYPVSVDSALWRGRIELLILPLCIFCGSMGILIWHTQLYWFAIIGVVVCILWCLWRRPVWQLWALENVADIHQVYAVAEREGWLPSAGSWLNKLEFSDTETRHRIFRLEQRLNSTPNYELAEEFVYEQEVEFHYGYGESVLAILLCLMALILLCSGAGVLQYGFALFFAAFGVKGLFDDFVRRSANPYFILLNSQGITVAGYPTIRWADLIDAHIRRVPRGRHSYDELCLHDGREAITADLSLLRGSTRAFEKALYTFLGKYGPDGDE